MSSPSPWTATPRCLKPPGGAPLAPPSYARGSNAQSSVPVPASRATTRVYIVETYRVLSIISGVTWKLPGRVPYSWSGSSPGSHSQAISSWSTFSSVTCAAVENLVWAWSAPTKGHSTMTLSWLCARAPRKTAEATAATRTTTRPTLRLFITVGRVLEVATMGTERQTHTARPGLFGSRRSWASAIR